jgi:hypothetical protein
MAKDKQKNKEKSYSKEVVESSQTESVAVQEEVETLPQEDVEVVAEEEVVDFMSLHDAARQFVAGFKEHHWAGMRRFASDQGFGEGGTEEACKNVLRHYGVKI